MFNKKFLNRLSIIIFLSIIFLGQTSDAFARARHRPRPRPHRHYRRVVVRPRGYVTIAIGGLRYHCHRGVLYRKGVSGYVVVAAPVGAVIPILPIGYRTIVIGRGTYYYYGGVYYRRYPSGYVVVPAPVTTVVINIPNSNGSYTPVVLQKSGDGYVGPQGEYYPGHPTVGQLKVLYAKK